MLSPKESKEALYKWFRKRYIADLEQLFRVLETNSRMSVFRRLKLIGYLTSFTDAGRYYPLGIFLRLIPGDCGSIRGLAFQKQAH